MAHIIPRTWYVIAQSERAHNSDGKFLYDLLKLLLLQTAAIKIYIYMHKKKKKKNKKSGEQNGMRLWEIPREKSGGSEMVMVAKSMSLSWKMAGKLRFTCISIFILSSAHICIYLYIKKKLYSRESDPSIITNGCTRMWDRQRKFFVIKHFAATKWIQFYIAFIVFFAFFISVERERELVVGIVA